MENHSHKNKNSIGKSISYIIKQAKKGSKVHIAIIVCSLIFVVSIGVFAVKAIGGSNFGNTDMSDGTEVDKDYDKDREALDTDQLGNTILAETDDAGQEYLDETLFIGDSNTVRTMAYGFTTWDNVVAAVSMGVEHIQSLKMTYFKGYKNPVTAIDAVKIIQPKRIIITYGTNDLFWDTDEFIKVYKEALAAIHEAYPYADIIVNAVPPLDKQRENTRLTMQRVDEFNKAIAEMAKEEGYKFLNSSEALKDEKTGFAKTDYTIGDGVHLSKKGMEAYINYIKTHAYITEDTRPKPLNKVPAREETPTGIISQDPIAVRGAKVKVTFTTSDSNLGKVNGEIEQKLKAGVTGSSVTAEAELSNGGIFTGWSCSYGGLSSTTDGTVKFTMPTVDESVSEIVVTANFKRAEVTIRNGDSHVGDISLKSGNTVSLSAHVTEEFAGDKTVTWHSDDKSVATVDSNGNVTAVGRGSTKIHAIILNGAVSAYCTVNVASGVEGIAIQGASNIQAGASSQLSVVTEPKGESIDGANVTWSSDNEAVATVSRNGLVTGHTGGSATITAKYNGHTATYTVLVYEPAPTPAPEPTPAPSTQPEPPTTEQPTPPTTEQPTPPTTEQPTPPTTEQPTPPTTEPAPESITGSTLVENEGNEAG